MPEMFTLSDTTESEEEVTGEKMSVEDKNELAKRKEKAKEKMSIEDQRQQAKRKEKAKEKKEEVTRKKKTEQRNEEVERKDKVKEKRPKEKETKGIRKKTVGGIDRNKIERPMKGATNGGKKLFLQENREKPAEVKKVGDKRKGDDVSTQSKKKRHAAEDEGNTDEDEFQECSVKLTCGKKGTQSIQVHLSEEVLKKVSRTVATPKKRAPVRRRKGEPRLFNSNTPSFVKECRLSNVSIVCFLPVICVV